MTPPKKAFRGGRQNILNRQQENYNNRVLKAHNELQDFFAKFDSSAQGPTRKDSASSNRSDDMFLERVDSKD